MEAAGVSTGTSCGALWAIKGALRRRNNPREVCVSRTILKALRMLSKLGAILLVIVTTR